MKIEETKDTQLKALFVIHKQCFQVHIEEIWGWDENWQWDYFLKEWKNGIWRTLLDGEAIIGYLVWNLKTDHLYLNNICFLPEYQGKGLGKSAMNFIEKLATERNLPVKLSTFRTNQRVLSFYEKLGYKVIEEVETGLRMSKDMTDHES